jgi:hypothetical protein
MREKVTDSWRGNSLAKKSHATSPKKVLGQKHPFVTPPAGWPAGSGMAAEWATESDPVTASD